MRHCPTRRCVAALVTATALVVSGGLGSTAFATSKPDPVGPRNSGVADIRPATYSPPVAGRARIEAKQHMAANIEANRPLMQGVTGGVTTASARPAAPGMTLGGGALSAAAQAALPNSAKATHYLRAGHYWQKKDYTCGPSATRNLIRAMAGVDEGETKLAALMGTDPSVGTYIRRIANVLNSRYWGFDYFSLNTPTSPANLLASTKSIVGNAGHGMVANVQTGYLWYWQGQWTTHYNLVYGWSGPNIYVFDEFNASALGYRGSNPAGYWPVSANNLYAAIRNSPTGQFVG